VEEETSAHVLCDCEALASLRNRYLGSFSWNPGIFRMLIWELSGAFLRPQVSRDKRRGTKGLS
jgi:hypothetical protein